MKKLIFVALVSILFSCNKQPVVSFTTDGSSYFAGDIIKLTNTSKNTKSYLWTMPDGSLIETKDAEYLVDPNLYYNTTIKFKLTGFSRNKKKSTSSEQYITIVPARGNIVFWKSSSCGCGDITVTVDGNDLVVNADYSSAPPYCNNGPGAASFTDLLPGNYSYSATDGTKTWSGNFTITKGCCLNIQLN